ncbi:MAG: hypothetical protein OQK82_04415 [Candidatus Pacearchaeota archaeon]|nr:hypothetical protein [Candidatus Pacearchaeota archaeon]
MKTIDNELKVRKEDLTIGRAVTCQQEKTEIIKDIYETRERGMLVITEVNHYIDNSLIGIFAKGKRYNLYSTEEIEGGVMKLNPIITGGENNYFSIDR